MNYKLISQNAESTVVAEFEPSKREQSSYQTEAELEEAFIRQLIAQGYEYLEIKTENDLIDNLRKQLERLNNIRFSDREWENFFRSELANPNHGIVEKTASIQEDHVKILKRDDGSSKNIYLINKENIHENHLQVINQYENLEGMRKNRYDVTVLVNGIPMVHIELKRRGVLLEEAFNQINRYQRESFWAGSGLFEYVQIFVISNGTHTKYYSNTTRYHHLKELEEGAVKRGNRTSNSFEFTSWWADANNNTIMDLMDFARTFFVKNTILNLLTRYCVFTVDRLLLVMRPYQIAATERILNKIVTSTNYKKLGTKEAGGYIWHTTGSGKTLTSFKTAQLASRLEFIDKVLFVVDRKDLDYQTMREYDRFEKGAANSNTSTAVLKKQLEDPNARIIITTIQKLERFIKSNLNHKIYDAHVVLIFDECHRSQFGTMHEYIIKSFKNYHIFGFTGTPIFPQNATRNANSILKTTEQVFGERLHTYNIVNAIADRNVLPFKVDYVSTMREKENISDEEIYDINKEAALLSRERISKIVRYIIEHFDQKTKRNIHYKLNERRLTGFNSILAVSSIEAAKKYYDEFKKQLKEVDEEKRLKVALIYSFGVNEDIDGVMDENSDDTSGLDQDSRNFLEMAIQDYNAMFGTSFDTSSEKFQNYYKDVSKRVKDREIDLLIVVNMFLTGFDATTLNTLWVDKNLRYHGLLQAFSRTNRILNSIKTHGNIVCFRNLEEATNQALALFGDKDAGGIVLIRPYEDYYYGYIENGKKVHGYKELIEKLTQNYSTTQPIISEASKKEFVKLFGQILKLKNILSTFDQFSGNEILDEADFQDYQRIYIDLYHEFRKLDKAEKEIINDDLVFEIEIIKQIEINIDYILELVSKYKEEHKKNVEALVEKVDRMINSSVKLRNKKDLILEFIRTVDINQEKSVFDEWKEFVDKRRNEEIEEIIKEENLNEQKTKDFISNSFKNGFITDIGTEFSDILPPLSRFTQSGERTRKRERVFEKLRNFFERFFDISSSF